MYDVCTYTNNIFISRIAHDKRSCITLASSKVYNIIEYKIRRAYHLVIFLNKIMARARTLFFYRNTP